MTEGDAAQRHGTNEGSLWGARFASGPAPEMAILSKSTHFDWRLAQYDIAGSRAHAIALHAANYLSDDELRGVHSALDELSARVADGRFQAAESDEDVHGAARARSHRDRRSRRAADSALAAAETTRSPRSSASGCAMSPNTSYAGSTA